MMRGLRLAALAWFGSRASVFESFRCAEGRWASHFGRPEEFGCLKGFQLIAV